MRDTARFFSAVLLAWPLMACQPTTQVQEPQSAEAEQRVSTSAAPPSGVYVVIDAKSLAQLDSDSGMLYVFLRKPGERMPLTVEYFALDHLPKVIPFLLDEGLSLEDSAGEIEIVARVAPAGQVEKRPEDLETVLRTVAQHPPVMLHMVVNGGAIQIKPLERQVASLN